MRFRGILPRAAAAFSLAVAGLLTLATRTVAQDFELHPGYIEGTVQLGDDVVLTSGSVSASAYDPATGLYRSASTSLVFPSGPGNTATYHLTVESGASGLTYTVYASGYASGAGYLQVSLPGAQVAVTEGNTSLRDFLFPDYHLGTVNVTVDVSGVATLEAAYLNFYSYDAGTGINCYANGFVPSTGSASLRAGPGSVTVYATAQLSVGGTTSYYPLGTRSLTLASGGVADLAYSLHVDPFDPGSIAGLVEVNGVDVDYFYIQAYGGSPSQSLWRYVGGEGSYVFDPANPGSWYLYAYAYDSMPDSSTRYYRFPYRYISVAPGQDVSGVDFTADAAFVGGTLGTGDWRDPYYSSFSVNGYSSDGAYAGQSWFYYGQAVPESLDYELFVSAGAHWQIYGASVFNQYYSDDFFSYSYDSVGAQVAGGDIGTPAAGETVALDISALDYRASTVTLRLTVAGGGTLSNPQVSAYGYQYGPDGQYLYSSSAYGSSYTPTPVATGEVTLILAPGTYNLSAYAYVQGSWTSFGQLANFVVLPGDDIVQDLDAPTLTLTSPAPLAEFECHEAVTISGTATDPSGVASVTVNGNPVTLAADGSFSTTLSGLPAGENSISIAATDAQGNSVTVSRTVVVLECTDSTPPVITGSASGTPNEFGWYNTDVTVCFEATDESGIADITPCTTLSTDGAGQSVTGTATDPYGNSASTTVGGINIDKTAPVVSTSRSIACLWSPNHKMVPVTVSGTISDLSGARTIEGFTISSNENDDDKGDGKTAGDCDGKDGFSAPAAFSTAITVDSSGGFSFVVNLRAERQGNANDRVYTIHFSVMDLAGNSTPVDVAVCVPHSM